MRHAGSVDLPMSTVGCVYARILTCRMLRAMFFALAAEA